MTTPLARTTRAALAGAALLSGSLSLSGCLNISTGFDGEPLAELDQSGRAPTAIGLAGPDDIVLAVGDELSIEVEGEDDVIETLRFRRSGDSLTVGRADNGSDLKGKAIIRITMPAPKDVSLAGSGDITAETLADASEVSIAGAGRVLVKDFAIDTLEIGIAGSGSLQGRGRVSTLEISIAGSGDVDFGDVVADSAEISIAGSGDVKLASDGKVDASIMGSGDVLVIGNATCTSNAVGSGTMTCKARPKAANAIKPDEGDAAD